MAPQPGTLFFEFFSNNEIEDPWEGLIAPWYIFLLIFFLLFRYKEAIAATCKASQVPENGGA